MRLHERGRGWSSASTADGGRSSARRSAAVAALVAVVYAVLALYVTWLNDPVNNGACFWPAAGITVAALLLVPVRHGWMVVAAVFAAELTVNTVRGMPPLPSAVWALANAGEPLLGALLVRRLLPDGSLVPARRLLVFLACAAGIAPAVGGAVGAAGVLLLSDASFFDVWLRWTVGDALGVLVMAPAVLAWRYRFPSSRRPAELVVVTVLVVAAAASALIDWGRTWVDLTPYLTLPALVWAATRFTMRGATLAGLVVAHTANLAVALGLGPFGADADAHAVTVLQLSLGITVGTGLVLAAMASDLTGRDEVERLLGHQAAHDHLTGLPNRLLLQERLAQVLERAAEEHTVAVLFLDLDRFKVVNDSLGHEWGDALLVETAARLQAAARPRDLVARLGGDEFVVVCADLEDPSEAGTIARRMLAAVCEPVTHGGRTVAVSTSIGIATTSCAGLAPHDVLRNADTAMYRAKRDGRSRIDFFDDALHAQAVHRLDLEMELRQSLAAGELRLEYQPILTTGDLRPTVVEALLRWEHPVRGRLVPGDFLEVAEDAGLLAAMGDWVVVQALQDLAAHDDDRLCLSLNVSATQLREGAGCDFAGFLLSTCRSLGVDPQRVWVELTETAVLEAVTGAQALLRLKAAGVRLALDDFGTGYASLAQLERLPFDVVKIDRSFVPATTPGTAGTRRLAAMVALVHSYDMVAVVEGVEDQGQLTAVRSCGGDLVQGFHVGAPAPWGASAPRTAPLAV